MTGFSVLHYAVEGGNRDVVKVLLQDGLGPNSSGPVATREFTPLHLAARAGHAKLVPLLLEAGYAADASDNEGRTPLHCAALGSQAGWVDATHAEAVRLPPSAATALGQAVIATELLSQGVDPLALDDALCSTLHYASGTSCYTYQPVQHDIT